LGREEEELVSLAEEPLELEDPVVSLVPEVLLVPVLEPVELELSSRSLPPVAVPEALTP
jgi:hypothetical protein